MFYAPAEQNIGRKTML